MKRSLFCHGTICLDNSGVHNKIFSTEYKSACIQTRLAEKTVLLWHFELAVTMEISHNSRPYPDSLSLSLCIIGVVKLWYVYWLYADIVQAMDLCSPNLKAPLICWFWFKWVFCNMIVRWISILYRFLQVNSQYSIVSDWEHCDF